MTYKSDHFMFSQYQYRDQFQTTDMNTDPKHTSFGFHWFLIRNTLLKMDI